jgi:hypothetical protein
LYPADEKKLLEVKFSPGDVKLRSSAFAPVLRLRARKKWTDFVISDLARIRNAETLNPQPSYRLVGPAVSGAYPCVGAMCDYNRLKAILCRVFRRPVKAERGIWSGVKRHWDFLLPDHPNPPEPMLTSDGDIQPWLDSMPSDRRPALQRAWDIYRESGWSEKHADFQAFLKLELIPAFQKRVGSVVDLFDLEKTTDRLIQAPHDVTHVIAGPWLKPYLGWLKDQWGPDDHIFYGGTTPDKLLAWLQDCTSSPRTIFWSDYSMFDSSHCEESWALIEQLYARAIRECPDLQKVLDAWRCPSGKCGQNLRYRAPSMNASGRDDTALANALLNGFAMYLSLTSAWYQVPVCDVRTEHLISMREILRLSVCGDDALGFLPPMSKLEQMAFRERMLSNFRQFGLSAKFFMSEHFEDAVYLGHRPLPYDTPAGVKWYWTRTLGRCLYKLGFQPEIKGDPTAYFAGICDMHQQISAHVPVLSDLTRAWLELNPGVKRSVVKIDPHKPWLLMASGSPDTYSHITVQALARAYTVSAEKGLRDDLEQESVFVSANDIYGLISHIVGSMDGRACVLDHWLLRHMVLHDEE